MCDNREDDEVLNSSLIGTKDYWEECYEKELKNYSEFGDFGEIWFGLKNSRKIVNWIRDNRTDLETKVLDIGCGNGFLLIELAKLGYKQLFGADYSSNSIKFCRQMAEKELKSKNISIVFQELDILSDVFSDESFILKQKFDCLIDKGTYDAICLQPNVDITQIREKYSNFVLKVMSENSVFILMSCNFTKRQLFKDLKISESFALIHEIESPVFSFGGQTGSQVTGLVLTKLSS